MACFHYSESELTNCSLQVLNCSGSSGRFLLDMLKERGCTLAFLLQCLRKMEHHEAIEYLTTAGTSSITIHYYAVKCYKFHLIYVVQSYTDYLLFAVCWFVDANTILLGVSSEELR